MNISRYYNISFNISNKIVTIIAAKKDNQEQDLTLVYAEIPVHNLPNSQNPPSKFSPSCKIHQMMIYMYVLLDQSG